MTAGGQQFIFDVRDGAAGYNTDPARGADTFRPFNSIVNLYKGMLPITIINVGFSGITADTIFTFNFPIEHVTKIKFEVSGFSLAGSTRTIQIKNDSEIVDQWVYTMKNTASAEKELNCKDATLIHCEIKFTKTGGTNTCTVQVIEIS